AGTGVVWPDGPMLAGITMQLLEPRLAGAGLPARRRPVRLADLPSFAAVFVTNSRGIAPVGRVDDLRVPVHPGLMKTLAETYDSVPRDEITRKLFDLGGRGRGQTTPTEEGPGRRSPA